VLKCIQGCTTSLRLRCFRGISGRALSSRRRRRKFDENNRYTDILQEDLCVFMRISLSVLPRMRKVSHKHCREKKNTLFVFSNVFPKIMPFMRYVEKRDNMVHVHYMPDNHGNKHTLRIRNTLLFQGNNGYTNAPHCYYNTYTVC
jgi:hypothetical protein